MIHSILLALAFASTGYSQQSQRKAPETSAHAEAAENKGRTVPGGAGKGVKACHADIDRWCKDVKPGEGRLGACLKTHAKELSKRCRRWASHGGKEHLGEALLRDLDGAAAPAPAPVPAQK